MAQKDLLIGGFTNYNYNQLKPWIESADEVCGDNVDKVVVVGNTSQETIGELIKRGWIIVPMPQSNLPIHVLRFVGIYEYLKKHWSQYRYVVTTDVKDVFFQYSPFDYLEQKLQGHKLIAGSEGMLYKDEPWGNDNLMQAYGPYIYEDFKNNKIYNVGTLGGDSYYMRDLVFNIFSNATNRPVAICDQAVYNVLINTTPYRDVTFFADQIDGWACQAGTTVDPSKIEQFRPFLVEEEPMFDNGIVWTADREMFAIVHQYDRVPEWKDFIMKKYKMEDPSSYFVYRT